jgi:tetratricopeptide (TPR) repeat protein
MLEDSAAACRSALEVDAGADRPQDRAVTQTILTSALLYLGASSGGEESRKMLENAVAEYRSALEFYTEADRSEDWAMTQNMLGVALLGLGASGSGEESRKMLEEAVAACRSALEVYTKADVPQFWALTQLNLSLALLELGNRGGGNEESRKMLEEAVAACRSVLEVHTKADLPQFWAMTQNCLALGLWALGGQLKGEEGLKHRRESVEPLREVVAYQPDDPSRYQLATRLGSFAFYLILHRQFAEAQKRCEEAQALTKNIGDGIEKTDRDDLIFIQMNRAHALLFQGHYDEALAIYSQYWDKPLHGNTFGEVTLKDFAVFDKAGLTHPDLLRMKRTLGDLHSKAHSP